MKNCLLYISSRLQAPLTKEQDALVDKFFQESNHLHDFRNQTVKDSLETKVTKDSLDIKIHNNIGNSGDFAITGHFKDSGRYYLETSIGIEHKNNGHNFECKFTFDNLKSIQILRKFLEIVEKKYIQNYNEAKENEELMCDTYNGLCSHNIEDLTKEELKEDLSKEN